MRSPDACFLQPLAHACREAGKQRQRENSVQTNLRMVGEGQLGSGVPLHPRQGERSTSDTLISLRALQNYGHPSGGG